MLTDTVFQLQKINKKESASKTIKLSNIASCSNALAASAGLFTDFNVYFININLHRDIMAMTMPDVDPQLDVTDDLDASSLG